MISHPPPEQWGALGASLGHGAACRLPCWSWAVCQSLPSAGAGRHNPALSMRAGQCPVNEIWALGLPPHSGPQSARTYGPDPAKGSPYASLCALSVVPLQGSKLSTGARPGRIGASESNSTVQFHCRGSGSEGKKTWAFFLRRKFKYTCYGVVLWSFHSGNKIFIIFNFGVCRNATSPSASPSDVWFWP